MATTTATTIMKPGDTYEESSISSSSSASSDLSDEEMCYHQPNTSSTNSNSISNSNGNSLQEQRRLRLVAFWGNVVLSAVLVIGTLICVGAYVCLNNLDVLEERTNGRITKENLAVVFTTANALGFLNVAIMLLFYTKYIQRLLLVKPQKQAEFQAVRSNAMLRTLFPNDQQQSRMCTSKSTSTTKKNSKNKNDASSHRKQLTWENNETTRTAEDTSRSLDKVTATATSTTTTTTITNSRRSTMNTAPETLKEFLNQSKREASNLLAKHSSASSTSLKDNNKHIAELFLDCTVLFADIEGFTAWSSVRSPDQVFVLLETLFSAFDDIAARRKVFKVETVGDCYVAVCGLPDPKKDHAVIMARFARDILRKMRPLCKKLELTLGPDTGDLNIRIGLHSGPVTGGVLKGERRLQLFGDTVNVAARMEQTGQGGQIHVSHHTRELLVKAGKSSWLTVRPTRVLAKGKGQMDTYWLAMRSDTTSSVSDSFGGSEQDDDDDDDEYSDVEESNRDTSATPMDASTSAHLQVVSCHRITSAKVERLVKWNCDILRRLLKQIVARRQYLVEANPGRKADADEHESLYLTKTHGSLVNEVKESITLPAFNFSKEAAEQAESMELDPKVDEQLVSFVRSVAKMYTDNPFHNFEHASHVTMSVAKLLSRIVAPTATDIAEGKDLHDHTFGITSDPLTQFACVLSALIHDADHPGVPNAQLVKEQTEEAQKYNGQSVAEQNSVDRCWNLLMSSGYAELRKTIYTTKNGLERFRSLVVNSVMATDICDKELKHLRNARWERAFAEENKDDMATKNRKATIVIEHIIQASDVAHTMQHWHVYRKWNEKLFWECYKAYKQGRSDKNPIEYWYQGEIGFFDFYIIPLAKKLKECGVFGVSSDEYLNYALRNREEWSQQGHQVVEELIAKVKLLEEKESGKAKSGNDEETTLPVVARTA